MRILYSLLILALGYFVGIIYHYSFPPEEVKLSSNFKNMIKSENYYELNKFNEAIENVYKKEIKNDINESYEDKFQKAQLEGKIDLLAKTEAFSEVDKILDSNDEYKLYLKRMLIGDYFREVVFDNNKIDLLTDSYLNKMKQNPEKSFGAIESFLNIPDVGKKFPSAVSGLLIVSSDFKGIDSKIKEVAYDVATQTVKTNSPSKKDIKNENDMNTYYSSNFEMFVPIVAHRVYLNKESNSSKAIERTIDSISAQTDERIQSEMFRNFGKKYPKISNQLKEQLKDRGIKI